MSICLLKSSCLLGVFFYWGFCLFAKVFVGFQELYTGALFSLLGYEVVNWRNCLLSEVFVCLLDYLYVYWSICI